MKHISLILFAATVLLGCSEEATISSTTASAEAPLTVTDLRIPKPLSGMRMGAGYLTLSNNSTDDIRITRVSSPDFDSVEMHVSILEGGISRMEKLPEVIIPAGESVSFEPGAKHLMLAYPETIPDQVSLRFFSGDDPLLTVATIITKE